MNDWECILNNFRTLGGVADNIVIKNGEYGRGIFPIDSDQTVKIVIPSNLLLPENWLQIDDKGTLFLSDECNWDVESREFYLAYLREYGFNNKIKSDIFCEQEERFALPDSLKAKLTGFGMNSFFFQQPDFQVCLGIYKRSRRLKLNNDLHVLFPIIELLNHDDQSPVTFNFEPQLNITGKFNNEILINYCFDGDAVLQHQTYGFSTKVSSALSGAVSIKVGNKTINIARFINLYDKVDKIKIPKIKLQGNEINLSFLNLGNKDNRGLAKKIFLKLIGNTGLPLKVADEVFDGILRMNRQFFESLLIELDSLDGNAIIGLRNMARNQLTALS